MRWSLIWLCNCLDFSLISLYGVPTSICSSLLVLSCHSSFLLQLTTYTALLQVNSGQLETYIQTCPEPCFPWWKSKKMDILLILSSVNFLVWFCHLSVSHQISPQNFAPLCILQCQNECNSLIVLIPSFLCCLSNVGLRKPHWTPVTYSASVCILISEILYCAYYFFLSTFMVILFCLYLCALQSGLHKVNQN